MAIEFELRQPTQLPIETDGLVEAALTAASVAALERLPVQHGNRQVALAELFKVSGTPDGSRVVFRGELRSVHRIGEAMNDGHVTIDGDVGRHAGARMRGGAIEVRGGAGDWLGAEMRGGAIHVRGDAGDFVGAAYVGSAVGMRGGEIY
ncbi:MAG TPA: formylmethanofuran dehydrogenase subunit C, partial [Pirellulales bacterium]|nr:formylmethanofuran dehydrogenase subunit C [Pirellulales bacterium]